MLTQFRWQFVAVAIVALLGAVVAVQPADAQLVTAEIAGPNGATASLTLTWPQPADVTLERSASEVVLRFSQPLQFEPFAALAPRLEPWVVGLNMGYDSLVLELHPGVSANAIAKNGAILLTLTQMAVPPPAADPAEGPASLPDVATPTSVGVDRLKLLKAALLWATGDTWAAHLLLAELAKSTPDHPDVLSAQGVVAAKLGLWRQSAAAQNRVARAHGAETRGHKAPAGSEQAPRVDATWVHDSQEGVVARDGLRVAAQSTVAAGLSLSAGYELAGLRASTGDQLVPLLPQAVIDHRFAAGLRYDALGGSSVSVQVTGTPRGVGAIANAELWDRWGGTRVTAGWAEPRWDAPVLAALGTTRDSVGVSRTFRSLTALGRALHGNVAVTVAAALERWRSDREGDDVGDITATGGIAYTTHWTRPRLTVSYTAQHLQVLDGLGHQSSTSRVLVAVLPTSQIHQASAGLHWPIWRWLGVDAHAGYGLSLWGTNAALYGGGLGWTPPTGFRAHVRYLQGLSTNLPGAVSSALTVQMGAAF